MFTASKTHIDKQYIALVWEEFNIDRGIIDMPIRRKHESFIEREVGEGGKRAVTNMKL